MIKADYKEKSNQIHISLRSAGEEAEAGLVIANGFYYRMWYFNTHIKPVNRLHKFKATWEEGSPEKSYWEIYQKEYGISIVDKSSLFIYYGMQSDSWSSKNEGRMNGKLIIWQFPWRQCTTYEYKVLTSDPESVWVDGTGYDYPEAMRSTFNFKDYDGEELTATCFTRKRVWSRFGGILKWVGRILPKIKTITLDITFSGETGKRKGSWKGGTIGHSIGVKEGEIMEDTFRRYCKENNMTFKEIYDTVT